ncbi:MAG: OmpA family protein [Neisseria sp.]|nr:OmpA family protein [Neisseria sp.]
MLFVFDKSGAANMNAAGKAELDEFAAKVKRFDRLKAIRITGHTDRLGSDSYNLALSQRRAETVRQYLISRGVSAGVMSAQGVGKAQPVQECAAGLSRTELISCLQPNRRVEIEVDGSGEL